MAPLVRAETPMKLNSNLEKAVELLDSAETLLDEELETTMTLLRNLKSSSLSEVLQKEQRRKFSNRLFSLQRSRVAILSTKINIETIGITDVP
jgi:hypothetical protein